MKLPISSLLVLISVTANATSYVKQSPIQYFNGSEVVARIFVKESELLEPEIEGRKISCGLRVKAEVVELLKGKADVVEFIIDGMVLNPASEYLVFLAPKKSNNTTSQAQANSIAQPDSYMQRKACLKYNYDYEASWLNVSKFLKKWDKKDKKFVDWITPGYNVAIDMNSRVISDSVELRSLLVNGKLIEKNFWSISDGVVFPNEFWMYKGAFLWESYRALLRPREERDNQLEQQSPLGETH